MKEWSKEITPLNRFKSIPEATKLKMRFSGEDYPESCVKKSGPKQKTVDNPYMNFFRELAWFGVSKLPRSVEDILVGVSRLNWYKSEGDQKPLSVRKIMYLLGKFDKIDRSKVEWMLRRCKHSVTFRHVSCVYSTLIGQVKPRQICLKLCLKMYVLGWINLGGTSPLYYASRLGG